MASVFRLKVFSFQFILMIDSVIYNISGDRTRKTKLQTLAREFLEEKIQMGGQGHCSSEDSLACMKLVQLKLKKHPYYGDAVMNSIYSEQRAYPDMGTANYAASMLKQCVKAGNVARVVGVDDIADKYRFYVDKNASVDNVHCIKAESNRDVVQHLCADLEKFKLNIGHVRVASDQLDQEGMEKTLKKLDKWIGQVHAAAAQPALVAVVMTGRQEGGNGACFIHLKRDFIP